MLIHDAVYGPTEILEPVLLDVINAPSVQRLKHIAQFGLPDAYCHLHGFSRFDHSVGVLLLLAHLGASLEEQVAGLLHDVSHTAFSHATDWIYQESITEDGQDSIHAHFLCTSDLPTILETHGMTVTRIADHHLFSLLEQDAPALCADRVDYTLRECDTSVTQACLPYLMVHEHRIVFSDLAAAQTLAHAYAERQRVHWGSADSVSRYKLAGLLFKIGLKEGVITKQDFWTTDEQVLTKLEYASSAQIQHLLSVLKTPSLFEQFAFTVPTHKKFRHIDPDVLVDHQLVRLSEMDPDYCKTLDQARVDNAQGVRTLDLEDVVRGIE